MCYTNIDSLVVRKSLVKYEIVLWNDYLFCYLHTELAECKKIFDFPQKIEMLFVVDVEKINENLNKLQRADNFYLDFLLRIAEGIENKLENITNDKEKLLKEYEFYNLYSLLIYCAMHEVCRNRDSLKNRTLISIRRTGDGFHSGLFIQSHPGLYFQWNFFPAWSIIERTTGRKETGGSLDAEKGKK